MSKYIDLAKKLKALADDHRGQHGERMTAEIKLQEVMLKHGITMSQLEGDARGYQELTVAEGKFGKIFGVQVVANVCGLGTRMSMPPQDPLSIFVHCTKAQICEVQAKYDFWWSALQKHFEVTYDAFLQRNTIYAENGGTTIIDEIGDPNAAAQAEAALDMADRMKPSIFHRTLDKGRDRVD